MTKPDLSSIKNRLTGQQEPVEAAPKKVQEPPRIKEETHKQVAEFSKDLHKMAQEEAKKIREEDKVDLGPLPEGIVLDEPDDTIFYRNTSTDNAKVRAAIEKKCGNMDFADLIMSGRVIQDVPILSGKLEVTFQSLLGAETFWIEKSAVDYGKTEWSARSWMGYARLAVALKEINGSPLPDHTNKGGEITKKGFESKYVKIMSLSEKIIELLFINLNWFNDRVEKLYQDDFDLLKNG